MDAGISAKRDPNRDGGAEQSGGENTHATDDAEDSISTHEESDTSKDEEERTYFLAAQGDPPTPISW